jgi:enoyl-CoA hydratase/carnithine racemase
MSTVLTEVDEHVATISLHRPGQRNAVDPQLARELEEAVVSCDTDPSIRVIVLTGGTSVFCAGADLATVSRGAGLELFTEYGGFARVVRSNGPHR